MVVGENLISAAGTKKFQFRDFQYFFFQYSNVRKVIPPCFWSARPKTRGDRLFFAKFFFRRLSGRRKIHYLEANQLPKITVIAIKALQVRGVMYRNLLNILHEPPSRRRRESIGCAAGEIFFERLKEILQMPFQRSAENQFFTLEMSISERMIFFSKN